MGDFGDFVKEAFVGAPGLPTTAPLSDRVEATDRRMRTVSTLTWLGAFVGAGAAVWMAVLLLGDSDYATGTLVFFGAVFVWGIVVVAMVKTWHFQMQSNSQVMKEILRLQDQQPPPPAP